MFCSVGLSVGPSVCWSAVHWSVCPLVRLSRGPFVHRSVMRSVSRYQFLNQYSNASIRHQSISHSINKSISQSTVLPNFYRACISITLRIEWNEKWWRVNLGSSSALSQLLTNQFEHNAQRARAVPSRSTKVLEDSPVFTRVGSSTGWDNFPPYEHVLSSSSLKAFSNAMCFVH